MECEEVIMLIDWHEGRAEIKKQYGTCARRYFERLCGWVWWTNRSFSLLIWDQVKEVEYFAWSRKFRRAFFFLFMIV